MTSAYSDDTIPIRNSGISKNSAQFRLDTIPGIGSRNQFPESESVPGIPESVGIPGIPRNSVSIRFPEFLTRIGPGSYGINFKHITKHEGEGRRVIPDRNSGIARNSVQFRVDAIPGISFRNWIQVPIVE
jgi:hypothetical protein